MKAKPFLRRWERRVAKLVDVLSTVLDQCRKEGTSDQVHELRVTLRRLRLYVRAGQPLLGRKSVAAFRDWGRTMSKLTSPVRDLDVAIEWLQGTPDAAETIAICQRWRERFWQAKRARLPSPPDDLGGLVIRRDDSRRAARLAKRAEKHLARFEGTVREMLPQFFEVSWEAQHEFRRNLRWWRYLRELSLTRPQSEGDALLSLLVAAQEATGDRQNLALVEAALEHLPTSAQADALLGRVRAAQVDQVTKIAQSLAALAASQSCEAGPLAPDSRA